MTTTSQKTATIAATVLSVLALFQLIVVLIVFIRRPEPVGVVFTPIQSSSASPQKAESIGTPLKKSPIAPIASETVPDSNATPLENVEIAPSEIDILVKRATNIRNKGDMTGALASLRDAQKLYPDDPKIVAEFATTYEQMGLVDKALAQWKRVADAGEKAGDLYGVAAEKVRMGVMPKEPASGRDEEGLQPGSLFGLVDVTKIYENTAGGDGENVSLRMGIKARQNSAVIASGVNIQAMFYDLIDNKDVEPVDPASTTVTSEWLTTPPDWLEEGLEVLKVRYSQKAAPPDQISATERKYLGYIIRVYYENELQDVIADPVKLLQYFPPPVTLQKEIPE